MTRPSITQATAGFPASDAWWNAQVYNPINWLYQREQLVVKAATTSRASTTTIASDPEITFTVVANTSYLVEGLILFAADPASDLKIGWTAPTGATFLWNVIGQPSTASASTGSVITDGQDLASTAFGLGGVTDNTKTMTGHLRGYLTVGATGGTFALQWAQITSGANATKVLAGTHVVLKQTT
ncbi:hypothetical protein ABT167_27345 [Streptomyces sp. NPDC001792]|uniref:hypothetical protein n=1 Tax=Streptomyces sp. NPDC001792 TaxID=3154524 RepID=UPI00331ED87C